MKRSSQSKTRIKKKNLNEFLVFFGMADLVASFVDVLRPAPKIKLSDWSDENRILSREDSSEPGRWKTSRAEYQRGIQDAISDPLIPEVVAMKGTQVGWTSILGNVVGYFIDQDPASMLLIQPTVELAKAWSKERLAPMLRDMPILTEKVSDPRSRDSGNTITHKVFPGGHITAVGANAPSGLASRPLRILLCDETDRYPVSAGSEGDPMKLASKRQSNFWNRKTLKGSTPTLKGKSPIEAAYENSDKRRYSVPCHACGVFQFLTWKQIKWVKEKDENGNTISHDPETAYYQCEHCGAGWNDGERWEAVSKGHWIATAPFKKAAGFHVPQFLSPWVTLEDIVTEFLEAQGDPELLKVWTNTVLAETWEEKGESVDSEGLKTHVEDYEPYELPDGVHYMTAGVDVQGNRLEIEAVGWGKDDESWGVFHEILYGDPAGQQVWKDLEEFLYDRYWTQAGRLVKIRATCIDFGGHHGAEVIEFCKARVKRRIYPIKGRAGPHLIWPARASKTKTGETLWMVGVDTAKDAVYGRYGIKNVGPGYCHLPASYDDDWFDQATVEHVLTRYSKGRPYRVWECPKGKRNEGLDLRVYATAAQKSLKTKRMKAPSKIFADGAVAAKYDDDIQQPKKQKRQPVKRQAGSGFVGGWNS